MRLVAVDGSGALVEARDDRTASGVMVRITPPADQPGRAFRRRLRGIAKPLTATRHPNLVSVTAVDAAGGFLSYESVHAPTLRQILARTGALELDAALAVLYDCLAALEALHAAGITHGNLAPDAVVIEPAGIALVRDAGLAPASAAAVLPGRTSTTNPSDVSLAAGVFLQTLTVNAPLPPPVTGAPRAEASALYAQPARVREVIQRGLHAGARDAATAASMNAEVDAAAASLYGTGWLKIGRASLARAAALAASSDSQRLARRRGAGGDTERIAAAIGWLEHGREEPLARRPLAAIAAIGVFALAALVVFAASRGPARPAAAAERHPLSFGALPFVGSLATSAPDANSGLAPGVPSGTGTSSVHPVAPAYVPPGASAVTSTPTHAPGPASSSSGGTHPQAISLALSTLTGGTTQAAAGSLAPMTVHLASDNGAPLAGKSVTLQSSTGDSSAPVTTGSNGQVSFMVTNFSVGTVTYSAVDSTDDVTLTQHPAVTWIAGSWAVSESSVSPNGGGPVAEQYGAQVTVTVQLEDQYGNPVAGMTVGLASNSAQSTQTGMAITDSNGIATFTVSDANTTGETVTYTVTDTSGTPLSDAGGGQLTTMLAWQPAPAPSPTPTPTPTPAVSPTP